jgi:hypothetical protein
MSEQLKELLAEQIKLNVEAVLKEEEEFQRGQAHPNVQPSGTKELQSLGMGGGSMDQRKQLE